MATYTTAKTQYLSSTTHPSTEYAYLLLGAPLSSTTTPLLYLTHFRSTIDKIDPLLLTHLSSSRPVILVDYAGHGKSTGTPAITAAQSAAYMADFLDLLGVKEVDVLGFSMGGFVAQMLALNHSGSSGFTVRRLIIAGTTASAGPTMSRAENSAEVNAVAGTKDVGLETFQTLFFHKNDVGKAASEAWWKRVFEEGRTKEATGEEVSSWVSDGYLDGAVGLKAQVAVLGNWMDQSTSAGREGSYERLAELKIPVLVANGNADFMVPTVNSFYTAQRILNAKLIVYPNSGHGFLFQYAEEFSADVDRFLA